MSTEAKPTCPAWQSPRTNAAAGLLVEVATLSLEERKRPAGKDCEQQGPKISSAALVAISCAWEETSHVGTVGRWIRQTCSPDARPPKIVCTICGDEIEPGWSTGDLDSDRMGHAGSVMPCLHIVGTECWARLVSEQGLLDCPVCGERISIEAGPSGVAVCLRSWIAADFRWHRKEKV